MIIEKEFSSMDSKKSGENSREKISQKEKELSIVNGYLKSKERVFLEPESLHADTVEIRVSISTKVLPL
jgi:hypothetical protein